MRTATTVADGASAAALRHVNVLLAVFAGAALLLSGRLAWDPTVYVPLREAVPRYYAFAAAALPAWAALMLLLAHLGVCAAQKRRGLLCVYAVAMSSLLTCEVWLAVWAYLRVRSWLRSPSAAAAADLVAELDEHVRPLLRALARLYPLPYSRIDHLLAEAETSLWRLCYAACVCAAALLLLQAGAVAAAVARIHSITRRHRLRIEKQQLPFIVEKHPLRAQRAHCRCCPCDNERLT